MLGIDAYECVRALLSSNESHTRSISLPHFLTLTATVPQSSEKVKLIRRQMNGLMNRLSDLSKDSVVRAVKAVFDANSLSVVSTTCTCFSSSFRCIGEHRLKPYIRND
jgi:hypothetical protein